MLLDRCFLLGFDGPVIDDQEQEEDSQEHDCHQRTQFRRETTLACIGIDERGERFQTLVALGEERYRKIVDGQGESQDETGNHPRTDLRENDFSERLKGRRSQVEGGLIGVRIHLPQLGHDAEHHIRGAERDVGKDDRDVSLRNPESDEHQEQGDTGDDVRIQHRDVIEEGDDLLLAVAHVEDADGGDRPQEGRENRRKDADGKRILNRPDQSAADSAAEKILVQIQGEPCPVPQNLRLGEGEDNDDYNRGVQDNQQQPDIGLGKKAFHQMSPPCSLSRSCSESEKSMVMPMMMSMIRARAAP